MRTRKTLAVLAITVTAALVAQGSQPLLNINEVGPNFYNLTFTAGRQGAPFGFWIFWRQVSADGQHYGHIHTVAFASGSDPCFSLDPGESVTFTLDGITDQTCVFNLNPEGFQCATTYEFFGVEKFTGPHSNSITATTANCP